MNACQPPNIANKSGDSRLRAWLPREVKLLGEGDSGIVIRHLARGGRIGAGQSNTVVDVQNTLSTAWGVDHASRGNFVLGFMSDTFQAWSLAGGTVTHLLGIDLSLGPGATPGE